MAGEGGGGVRGVCLEHTTVIEVEVKSIASAYLRRCTLSLQEKLGKASTPPQQHPLRLPPARVFLRVFFFCVGRAALL